MLTAADYSANGWQPIAIRPGEKRPLRQGWQTAALADTLAAIEATPGANIGLAVPDNLFVLDVDTKSDGPATLAGLEAKHGALPETLAATTATGGRHIWFALPRGGAVGNRVGIAPGLDIRAKGGYVVAPPSVIGGKAYAWDSPPAPIAPAPAWLVDLASRPAAQAPKPPTDGGQNIPEGMRNRTLFEAAAAMRRKGFSVAAIEAALGSMNAERCSPPLDDEEVADIAASAGRYAPDVQPWEAFAGNDMVERPQAPPAGFKLLSGAALCNAPPMRWIVRGVLPADGLAALYGASGCGKSFLTLDIAGAVAGGGYEWFGRRVTQCPVVYVCLEGEAGIGKRIKAWSLHHKRPVPDALQFVTQPFDLLSADVPELAKAVIAGGGAGGLVILDTLNRAAPGADENSSVDMGNLIAAAKALQSQTGGLVLLVHHTGKDTTKGLRGHSSLYAALDGAIEVTNTDTRRAWSVAKSKDDVTGDAHPFRLEIVPVGIDDDGEPVTSCAAVPDESAEAKKQAKRPTLRSNQKIANEALGDALRKSQHFGKEGAPFGGPCIQYTDAVAIVAERIPADAKHKTSRAKVAITGLVERGFLAMKGDWLWDN